MSIALEVRQGKFFHRFFNTIDPRFKCGIESILISILGENIEEESLSEIFKLPGVDADINSILSFKIDKRYGMSIHWMPPHINRDCYVLKEGNILRVNKFR